MCFTAWEMREEACPPPILWSPPALLMHGLPTPFTLHSRHPHLFNCPPHCGHCPFKPPPILHLHSPIKVDLKCSLFHEVLPDPPIHRDSASFGHLWDFAHISLVTLVTHCDSQLGSVYVCLSHPSLWSRRSSRTLTSSFLCPFPVPGM